MAAKKNWSKLTKRAYSLRESGKTWGEVGKTLHVRKQDIMARTKERFGLPSPRIFEWRDYWGKKAIKKGYSWKAHKIDVDDFEKMRTKTYPTWRWQTWLVAEFMLSDGTLVEAEGWSLGHHSPDPEQQRIEAISNARSNIGESCDLVRIIAERLLQFKALKD
jgi:hypothetical protein